MKFDDLLRLVGTQSWFDLASGVQLSEDIRQTARVQLHRWCKAGKLIPLRRGMYALPRFAEELVFSLHRGTGYRPEAWIKKIKNDLTLGGFDSRVIWNGRSTVYKCWVKVPRIIKEAGLAAMADQYLSSNLKSTMDW